MIDDEEETEAWELSLFPHLLLPDLVEAHIEKLNLGQVDTRHDELLVPHRFPEIDSHQRTLALHNRKLACVLFNSAEGDITSNKSKRSALAGK